MDAAAARKERLALLRQAKTIAQSQDSPSEHSEPDLSEQTSSEPVAEPPERHQAPEVPPEGRFQYEEIEEEEDDDEEEENLPMLKFRNYVPKDSDLREYKLDKPLMPTVEEKIKEVTAHHVKRKRTEENVLNVATKKPNWDLKRDVAKRLEKLNRRTQKAILELIQEKLKEEGDDESDSEEDDDDEEEEESEEEAPLEKKARPPSGQNGAPQPVASSSQGSAKRPAPKESESESESSESESESSEEEKNAGKKKPRKEELSEVSSTSSDESD